MFQRATATGTAAQHAPLGGFRGTGVARCLRALLLLGSIAALLAWTTGARAATEPNDPEFPLDQAPYELVHIPEAWEATTGSASVVIATIDVGVDASLPDLAGSVLPGWNTANQNDDTSDISGHGSGVAGVIVAHRDNGIGSAGVCSGCRLLPVRVFDDLGRGNEQYVADGIRWAADHGADIISLSLVLRGHSALVDAAVAYATARGILLIAAAGNDGTVAPVEPAALNNVVSVAALGDDDRLVSFSNHGPWVDLAAPSCVVVPLRNGGYEKSDCGTSYAAPMVAGIAGLALSYRPSLTANQLRDLLQSTAAPDGLDVQDGRVDALALMKALGYRPTAPTNTDPPALVGQAAVGSSLHIALGDWNGSSPDLTATLYRCNGSGSGCTSIRSGTGDYRVTRADRGHRLRVLVVASNTSGKAGVLSRSTAIVR